MSVEYESKLTIGWRVEQDDIPDFEERWNEEWEELSELAERASKLLGELTYIEDLCEDAMAEHGWVKLPLGADGEPIHVGDVVIAQLLFGGESKPLVVDRMELSRGRDGDLWCVALDTDEGCWNQPSMLRHHSPTVEDVLEEFAQMYIACNDKGTIAEYAKRLRLAGEE